MEKIVFDIIINYAEYTSVDKAVSETVMSNQVNHLVVKQLSGICKTKNIHLVQFVRIIFLMTRITSLTWKWIVLILKIIIAKTKLISDEVLNEINHKAIIIRTSCVCSEFGNNFVKSMLRHCNKNDSLNVVYV